MGSARTIISGSIHTHRSTRTAILSISDAGLHALLGKSTVAVVFVQLARLSVVRNENVLPSIAVMIEHHDSQRFAGVVPQTGFLGNVFKFSATEIPVEL